MNREEKEAVGWLSALDVNSECEATNKEIILNLIEVQEEEIEKLSDFCCDLQLQIEGYKSYTEIEQANNKQIATEIEKRDKIIDLMCEQLVGEYIWSNKKNGIVSFCNKEEVRQFFEKEVNNEN